MKAKSGLRPGVLTMVFLECSHTLEFVCLQHLHQSGVVVTEAIWPAEPKYYMALYKQEFSNFSYRIESNNRVST